MPRPLLLALLATVGLAPGRAAPTPPPALPEPGTPRPTPAPEPPVDLYAGDAWQGDWRQLRPLVLLDLLKAHPDRPVFMGWSPRDWVQPADLAPLVALLDSAEPVSATGPMVSAHTPPRGYHSSIGQEAARMLDSYRRGAPYPGAFADLGRPLDVAELRRWWHGQPARRDAATP